MTIRMSVSDNGEIRISNGSGSGKVRIEDVNKFLARNRDAILVKLEGKHDPSMNYKPGHICSIEEDVDQYSVFVGKHYIGKLPDEAIAFAEQVASDPDLLVAMVAKVENEDIYIYVAE